MESLILAPMAGVNDIAFRELCIECGAQLTYTEMISASGLDYKNDKTLGLLKLGKNEKRVVVQLFGHEAKTMAKQAVFVKETLGDNLAYIDINMGCPAKKIVSKGDGSALMDNPNLASQIVRAVSEVVKTSVKFRNHENVLAFAELMEKSGADIMCCHPRYAYQFYRGEADWSVIAAIKKNSNLPIIGSGDITSYDEAQSRLNVCDAVMIGRAAWGNPAVFSPVPLSRIELARKHLIRYNEIYGSNLKAMRKHCIKYVRGMEGAARMREAFCNCETLDDYLEVLDNARS
ncbi:MAG: tRNA-dihydrouridine synthase family protein [Coriobacteriia bacterium]|nr:tRNA-dihydrouridine synthase family protein [Coriobacteriia bacterium]